MIGDQWNITLVQRRPGVEWSVASGDGDSGEEARGLATSWMSAIHQAAEAIRKAVNR